MMIPKNLHLRFISACLLGASSTLLSQTTYEARHDAYYDDISGRKINLGQKDGPHRAGRTGFWTTQGRLQRGMATSNPGKVWGELKTTLLNADGAEDAGGANGGFSGWPGMDTYLRWQHLMPQDVKDAYTAEYLGMGTYGKGSTPNQRMMWAAACRLACETWGTAAVTTNSNAANWTGEPTGRQYISEICDRTVRYNFDERWAKHYLVYTTQPLLSIAQLSTDPVLANKARMTWNWGWMDAASFSFKGRWAIPAGRGGMVQDGNSSDISEHGSWLMFGGTEREYKLDYDQVLNVTQPPVGVPFAVTQPPIFPEMLDAATKRDVPYTRRGLARLHETQWATSYLTEDWTLYSQVEGDTTLNSDGTIKITDLDNNGVPSNDWNSERWGVMWDETGSAGLTMKPPTGYGWSQGTGLGPHEDVMQHEDTLVGIIDIPATWTWQYTNDEIPTNTTAVINDAATTGRLFLHYSKVLVAITRSDIGNFTWPPAAQTTCTKRGFAVECASLSEYPQSTPEARLAAFKADIEAHAVDTSHVNDATPRMIYTTRNGTVLDISYGLGGKVDGAPIDYESWPMNESPWTSQQQQGNMFVFGTDRTLLWNYKDWSERENRRPTLTTTASLTASGASAVDVDLSTRVTDAETPAVSLKYRVTGATNGTASILADGKTARFIPAANFAGAGTFNFTAGDVFPDSRLIFHYNFEQADPVASNVVTDVSSEDRHGSATVAGLASLAGDASTPTPLGAQSTKSLKLTSSNFGGGKISRQIYLANVNLANGDWTFASWVNRSSYTDDDFLFYVGTGDGFGGNGDELQLYMPAQSKKIALLHKHADGSTTDVNLSTAATVNANEWHHVVVQFERTSFNTGNVMLYLDGVLAGTASNITWALNQTSPVFIGGPALNTVFNRCFTGWLDDVALFRGKVSAAEIAELATGSVAQLGGLKVSQTVQVHSTPLPPAGLTATAANNVISLAWPAASGATSYTVKRGIAIGGPFTNVATGLTGTSYNDATAAFGTTYFYVVTATSNAGESANSNTVSATLPATDLSIWSGGAMNAWSKGARIGFPGYTQGETLTNFPVLVALNSTNIPGFSYAQLAFTNGADLRFTDATGSTELNYEIDTWNPAGTSYVWVQVPSFSPGTTICAFWGNSSTTGTAQPDSIANLSMWLKADAITGLADGATVNTWTDSSTNARNATLLSGTPVFKTNVLNGKPVVRFSTDGESGFSFPEMTDIRTVFWVVKETATTGIHMLLGDDINYDFHRGTGGPIWSPTNASANIRNGTTRLMGNPVNGTTTQLGTGYRLVSVVTTGNILASRLSKDRTQVGRSWDGDVAEVIIYNRALTENEEAQVGNYLAQKYALAATYPPAPPAYTTNGSTWSNGYLGVFHLRETSGQHYSSTSGAAATRTVSATNQGTATGIVGGADNFNGTSGYVSLPDLGSSPQVTVEAWVNLTAAPGSDGGGIVSSDPWSTGYTHFKALSNRSFNAAINASGVASSPTAAVPLGAWSHLAYTVAGSGANNLALYQDGVLRGSAAGQAGNNLTDLNIAREYSGRYLNARFDEIRISSVARSAAWLRATNANIVSPAMFHRGAPVATYSAAASPQVTTLAATAISGTGATLNGNLAYTGSAATSVTLYWGPVNGGTAPANWANSVALGVRPVGTFSTNLVSLTSGGSYFFRAFATNANGSTWASDALGFSTSTGAPASLTASPAGGLVGLSWAAAPGAQSYNVKRATVNGGPYATLLGGVLGTTLNDTTAAGDTTYYYVVTAVSAGGESGNSPQATVQTVLPPLTISATPGNASVALSWSASSGATSYTVKRATTSGGSYSNVQSGIVGTSYTDTTAVNGTLYFYAVAAVTSGFESAVSDEASAKPLASIAPPTGLVGTPSTTSIALTWNLVADAQSYKVKRATVDGGPYTQIASGLFAPNYNNTGLVTGTTYYYVVTAVSGSIESANSTQLAVTPATTPTTFNTPSAGNWSTAVWTPQPPISAFATIIVLSNTTAVTSAHNLGLLLLNKLQLTNQAVMLDGDSLYFAGTNPAISTTQNVAHSITNAIGLDTQTSISIAANTATINGSINGAGGITKSGAGTLVLGAVNTYAGGTTLDGGTLRFTADDADVNALTFGGAAGSANFSTLDLTSASIGTESLTVQTNSASNNTISIGAGRTLSVSGNLNMGTYSSSASSTCKLVATGSGSLNVASLSGSLLVGTTTGGSGVTSTLDLSGLASFSLDYGADGQLVIGNGSSANTLTLSPNTNLSVGSIRIADYQTPSSTQSLKLGSGMNTIHTDSISIGTTAAPFGGGRGIGFFQFNGVGGSVVIRDHGGIGGPDVSIADDGGSGNGYGTFDVRDHNADIKIHALRMGASTSATARTDTFSFNQGTLDIRSLDIGLSQNSASYQRNSQINIGGGNVTLGLGDADDPVLISLARNATGVLNLTGGNVAAFADIAESSGTGSATLTLNGATLDLNGNSLVDLTTLNLQSGTLKNVAQINSGAAITKSGTGTLILDGTNTITSPVTISAGTLQIGNGGPTGTPGTGPIVNNGSLRIDRSGTLDITNTISGSGSLTKEGSGTITLNGANTYTGITTINGGTLAANTIADATSSSIGLSALASALTFGSSNGSLHFTGATGATTRAMTFTGQGAFDIAGGSTLSVGATGTGVATLTSGSWTGNGGIVKSGDGTLTVRNNSTTRAGGIVVNSVTGGTFTMNAGTLNLSPQHNANSAHAVIGDSVGNPGIFNQTGGAVNFAPLNASALNFFYVGITSAGTLNVSGGTFTADSTKSGGLQMARGTAGTLTIGGGLGTALVDTPSVNFGISTAGTGTLNLLAHGTLLTSKVSVSSGTNTANFDGGTLKAKSSTTTLMSGLTSATLTANGLIVDTNSFDVTIAQALSGTGGTLTKNGTGTLTLSGLNTYTGVTTASAGKLVLSGTLTSPITVTATLAAQGTPATTSSLDLQPTGHLEVRPGDILTVGGSVTLGGNLDIIAAPGLTIGTSYTILNNTSAGDVSGSFVGKPQSSVFTASGYAWQISYTGGTGNDIVITLQPSALSAVETWRQTHFGTTENTGDAADSADPDKDGEINLLEFATGQNPHAGTTAATNIATTSNGLVFTYSRSRAALDEGWSFIVEYSDSLIPPWIAAGSGTVVTDGPVQTVSATVPNNPAGPRFIRLRVCAP